MALWMWMAEKYNERASKVCYSRLVKESRSGLDQPLRLRIMKTSSVKKLLPSQTRIEHPLLDKISAAYNGYRQNLMMKMSQAVEVIHSDPQLREAVLGSNLVNMFSKTASSPMSFSRFDVVS
jgi:hypothetical protein